MMVSSSIPVISTICLIRSSSLVSISHHPFYVYCCTGCAGGDGINAPGTATLLAEPRFYGSGSALDFSNDGLLIDGLTSAARARVEAFG